MIPEYGITNMRKTYEVLIEKRGESHILTSKPRSLDEYFSQIIQWLHATC